jgi:predicted RecB family nuclease
MSYRLTKSTFVKGWQCPNLLWWEVNEPEAAELVPSLGERHHMEQGKHVDRAARDFVPGGVLIPSLGLSLKDRIEETQAALAGNAPVIYNACFAADSVFVAVDILERTDCGWNLSEVKSTTSVKDEHIPDAAIQAHVLGRSGVCLERTEVMHLNGECRYPDIANLFVREDVSEQVAELLPGIPEHIEQLIGWLGGENPEVPIGEQCYDMRDCAFRERCWPKKERDHVLTLYRVGLRKAHGLMKRGVHSIHDLPPTLEIKLTKEAQRQVRAIKAGNRIIGPGLEEALAQFECPIAYLDFETVFLAIPRWNGCVPWEQVPVQFSCHVETAPGKYVHHEWLAEGPGDPREALAIALIEACKDAKSVVAYYASFERGCIERLAEALPHLSGDLEGINERLVDLHPVVKDHVYDPAFEGSFSLKAVVPALVPRLGYDDLEVAEGLTASAQLAELLLQPDSIPRVEREKLRRDLLAYCERDTAVMVGLLETLRGF